MSNQMDKIFREKLGRYKAPVEPDLWAAIAADQARKRRKSRLLKIAMYSSLLLLVLSFAYIAYTASNNQLNNTRIDNTTIVNNEPADTKKTNTTTLSNTISDNKATVSNDGKVTSEVANTSTSIPTNAASANQLKPTTTQSASNESNARNAAQASNNLPQPQSTSSDNGSNNNSSSNNSNNFSGVTTSIAEHTSIETTTKKTARTQFSATAQLPRLPLPLLSPRAVALPELEAANVEEQGNGFSKSNGKRFEIDLLAGPAYANQMFRLEDESHRDLLAAREISEFPEVSFLAGLRVAYRLKGPWSLRSGLLYTQIRNQFEYEQRNSSSEPTILIKSSNRIQMLEIPLLASYELPGKRFRLAVNAGPVINIATTTNGRYLLPDLMRPVSLKGEENIYRNNVGISYQASLTAAYDLGMGNSLLIEPTFKSYRKSFTKDSYALGERYWLAGLQIGLRHRIR